MYEKLLKELEARNISRYELAKLSKISKPDIYNALTGKKPLYPSWRKRIAEALGMAEEDLF